MFVCVNLDDDISKYIPQVLYKILNLKLDIYIYIWLYIYIYITYILELRQTVCKPSSKI